MSTLTEEISKRRTFAIISHPDAGKTTLTEKLLLFGGAIHIAGAVKSNKIKKTATSDWMEIEKQRGISVATSVMGFNYGDYKINILDTPGHQDFAEDTYRTLTAVDSVIIVVDVAKGVETQTRKLMEVCRMRNTPVIVFVNNSIVRVATVRHSGRIGSRAENKRTAPQLAYQHRTKIQRSLQYLRTESKPIYTE